MFTQGLKLGRVIRVIRFIGVMFCLGETGLNQFMKLMDWPEFCMGSHLSIVVSGSDQSDELGVLHVDDGDASPQNRLSLTAVLDDLTVQLKYFNYLVQCHTFQKYIATNYFQINYVYIRCAST